MAKQRGLHKIAGKVGEHSYYSSKVGGFQIRSINTGLSARVKTAPEYANVRLNNAEFGALGDLAGSLVRVVSQRWRYILNPTAVGDLVRAMKPMLNLDLVNPWGQRTVGVNSYDDVIDSFNRLDKNGMWQMIVDYIESKMSVNPGTRTLTLGELTTTEEFEQELIGQGIDGFVLSHYAFRVSVPQGTGDGYTKSRGGIYPIEGINKEVILSGGGNTVIYAASTPALGANSPIPTNDNGWIGGYFVVILPFRRIGRTKYVLQEHCRAYLHSLSTTA